ncbi:MAG TPA: RluA family pseudouridine synthase [bacterium]|nr:RluA family pseudouridine synthase [bacterium]
MDYCYLDGKKYALDQEKKDLPGTIEARNRLGEPVLTQRDWIMAARFCDEAAKEYRDRRIISTSVRGLFLGDQIEVILPLPEKVEAQAEDIPIRVVYEDDDILVVNKSAGMVVHPAYANYTGTLVNALLHHVQDLSGINGELRPGIVHRIDKDTSGLLLVAKHDRAHRHLSKLFKDHNIEREYWALVWGKPKKKKDTIETLIGRSTKDRKKFAVTKEGKNAITHYELITAYESVSLIRCRLETGRTHQIRVHMNYIGHPILGDKTYGGDNPNLAGGEKKKKQHAENILALIPRQALHAKTLGFIHPTTKKMMRFDSELPDDFNAVLQLIK